MWLLKGETQIDDDTIQFDVQIHSACCRGITYKYYYETKTGKLYNHQYVEVGEAARDAVLKAREVFKNSSK